MTKKELLDYALEYAARGWPVFPLSPREKKPLKGTRGFLDASTNERILNRFWDANPNCNIGVATGKESGFFVIDIDGEKGSKSFTQLETELGALPDTLEQKTGSGVGRQLFFRWPATREVRNKQNLRPGVDIRGDGGYIVVPPSIHPSGGVYEWPYGDQTPIAEIPPAWLDFICPPKKVIRPWERPKKQESKPVQLPTAGSAIIERAKRYLAECEPAVQGSGGHDALLWAARAMVVGFELDDSTAISLLWNEFNPRCQPPWDMSKTSEKRDFERKVAEARRTPGEKPRGWLKDEYGLRSGQDALAQIAIGQESARNLLSVKPIQEEPEEEPEELQHKGFPADCFPPRIADYVRQVTEAHCVDESFVALPVLGVAAAAMGNVWRLQLKKGFIVPPTLWIGIVSASGTNKSGPLNEVTEPLRKNLPIIDVDDNNMMLNPQGRMVVSDATLEAMIARLQENPRGLLVFRDELAGWVKSFNAYKKSGGDEQSWLEFWGAKEYHMDRKTNNEQVRIPAASVCIMGGIQPKVLVDCFDPGKFASGLVPRLLITCPPATNIFWSEAEVADSANAEWKQAVTWLRTRPFAAFDPNNGQFMPHVLTLTDEAKAAYVTYFNLVSCKISQMENEQARGFASKAREMAGRLTLIHRGLWLACKENQGKTKMTDPVGVESVIAGTSWARWCLNEQMRVYGYSAIEYARNQAEYLFETMKNKGKVKAVPIRLVMRMNSRRFKDAKAVTEAIDAMVQAGYARWDDGRKQSVTLITEG